MTSVNWTGMSSCPSSKTMVHATSSVCSTAARHTIMVLGFSKPRPPTPKNKLVVSKKPLMHTCLEPNDMVEYLNASWPLGVVFVRLSVGLSHDGAGLLHAQDESMGRR